MRQLSLVSVAALLLLTSCTQFLVSAQAGYAQMSLDGDIGYVNGSSSASINQDVESAFGLGDDQGTAYGRAAVDLGVPVVTISGFRFEETGTGLLSANFGDISASGGFQVPVDTEFALASIKTSLAFGIPIGPVTISPGLGANYLDLEIQVRDQIGVSSENVDLQAPIPMGVLRGEADIGIFSAMLELGYVAFDIEDVDGKLLDIEAMVTLHATSLIDVFVGYRSLQLQADGLVDGDTFDTDITLSGFLIGGGLRF